MFCSILISNYNKAKYIKNCINSCLNQNYQNYEILIGDNGSNDGSLEIINNYKSVKLFNVKKDFETTELNQLNILKNIFKYSKGDLIFLLDSDDYFEKNKLQEIVNIFLKHSDKEIVCDVPKIVLNNNILKNFNFKNGIDPKKRWPTIFPTSSISVKRESINNFFNLQLENDYPELAVDFRIITYFYNLKKNFYICDNFLTNYLSMNEGNESKYPKYSLRWWKRRYQSYIYLKEMLKNAKIDHSISVDYIVTKIINKYF